VLILEPEKRFPVVVLARPELIKTGSVTSREFGGENCFLLGALIIAVCIWVNAIVWVRVTRGQ